MVNRYGKNIIIDLMEDNVKYSFESKKHVKKSIL